MNDYVVPVVITDRPALNMTHMLLKWGTELESHILVLERSCQ